MNRIRFMLPIVLIWSLVSSFAQETERGFKTPSSNIFCSIYAIDGNWEIRCDILQTNALAPNRPPPRPADCNLDWGNAFFMTPTGRASRICHGDTVANPNYPTLAYGQTLRYQGFTCVSKTTGLRCTNTRGRGFELSRAKQVIF